LEWFKVYKQHSLCYKHIHTHTHNTLSPISSSEIPRRSTIKEQHPWLHARHTHPQFLETQSINQDSPEINLNAHISHSPLASTVDAYCHSHEHIDREKRGEKPFQVYIPRVWLNESVSIKWG
jgi:hypothetical protein